MYGDVHSIELTEGNCKKKNFHLHLYKHLILTTCNHLSLSLSCSPYSVLSFNKTSLSHILSMYSNLICSSCQLSTHIHPFHSQCVALHYHEWLYILPRSRAFLLSFITGILQLSFLAGLYLPSHASIVTQDKAKIFESIHLCSFISILQCSWLSTLILYWSENLITSLFLFPNTINLLLSTLSFRFLLTQILNEFM